LRKRPSVDLFHYIDTHQINEKQARFIFGQVVAAMRYLNSLGLIHGDIKDENILIDDNLKIRFIDFGSVASNDPKVKTPFMGTLDYASPETLLGHYNKLPGEVWALGCLLYILLTGNVNAYNPRRLSSLRMRLSTKKLCRCPAFLVKVAARYSSRCWRKIIPLA
jgi:serine/threonine protein kinase